MNCLSMRDRPICVFGWGTLLEQCFEELSAHLGGAPDFICDNASAKWGGTLKGVTCISPEQLAQLGNVLVVVTVRNFTSIVEQLKGYRIDNIRVVVFERSAYRITALTDPSHFIAETLQWRCEPVQSRWALITGASRGLGREIALFLAAEGCNLVLHARRLDHLDEIRKLCHGLGVTVEVVQAELSNQDETDRMLREIEGFGSPISYLFNNAAYSPPVNQSNFFSIADKDFYDCFSSNTLAPIKIASFLLPRMLAENFGRIINISSGVQFKPEAAAYAVSKAGLDKFVFDMCPKLVGTDVSMTLVDPGTLSTDMTGNIGQSVDTAFPGIVLAAFSDCRLNGKWIFAQDYRGLDMDAAIERARLLTQF
jgi:3-oxoacyl-[acyl-carrier protein] reductase